MRERQSINLLEMNLKERYVVEAGVGAWILNVGTISKPLETINIKSIYDKTL